MSTVLVRRTDPAVRAGVPRAGPAVPGHSGRSSGTAVHGTAGRAPLSAVLRVVGAGIGRTGTNSLKLALEQLLGAPCYHMIELFGHPDHVPMWHAAARGEAVDWDALFDGYAAAVDWPPGSFWPELTEAYPDAVVLLSTRASAEAWWKSADATIFATMRQPFPEEMRPWREMVEEVFTTRFAPTDPLDAETAMAAYERHNAAVRAGVPAERLVEWQPGDGWEPLCAALGVEVPDEEFPRLNTSEDWGARH
jgi:hypothetical protein